MKIPKRMLERSKEIIRRDDVALTGSALKTRPIARQDCERCEPALRVI
jgi:hypothetical protein